jgi:hypothetical protein
MPNYEREPLDEFEEVRGVFYGGYGQVGQQFVITNRRLLMAPIKLIKNMANDTSIRASAYVAGQLGMPGADLVGEILQSYAPSTPKRSGFDTSSTYGPGTTEDCSNRRNLCSRPIRRISSPLAS